MIIYFWAIYLPNLKHLGNFQMMYVLTSHTRFWFQKKREQLQLMAKMWPFFRTASQDQIWNPKCVIQLRFFLNFYEILVYQFLPSWFLLIITVGPNFSDLRQVRMVRKLTNLFLGLIWWETSERSKNLFHSKKCISRIISFGNLSRPIPAGWENHQKVVNSKGILRNIALIQVKDLW